MPEKPQDAERASSVNPPKKAHKPGSPPSWPAMPEDPKPQPASPGDQRTEWPKMPEDPLQAREEGEGECPCFVRVRWVRVGGGSTSHILQALAALIIDNPEGRDLYHGALEVQLPEQGECPTYVIEMQNYLSDPVEASKKGQVVTGDFGGFGTTVGGSIASTWGPSYGVRRWRNGEVEDGDDPGVAHAGRQILSRDCDVARRVIEQAENAPANPYSTSWTSNSVIGWVVQSSGLDASKVTTPVHGLTPGFAQGAAAATN